jgi:hypothetical protein
MDGADIIMFIFGLIIEEHVHRPRVFHAGGKVVPSKKV